MKLIEALSGNGFRTDRNSINLKVKYPKRCVVQLIWRNRKRCESAKDEYIKIIPILFYFTVKILILYHSKYHSLST